MNSDKAAPSPAAPPAAPLTPRREYHTPIQPLEVAQDDDALLRIETCCALAGVSKTTLYDMIRAGTMPPLVKLGRASRLRAGPFNAALAQLGKSGK